MSAKSMYSYRHTLYAILDEFQPKTAFEYGTGTSTQIMALYPSVKTVISVEHDEKFYDLIERLSLGNVMLSCKSDMDEYVNELSQATDLVFIDGRNRAKCLEHAKNYSDIVVLHDARREEYRTAILTYQYQIWTDEGNTVVLTDDEITYGRLKSALEEIECVEPFTEKIIYVGDVAV